jgi:hypothetical protein
MTADELATAIRATFPPGEQLERHATVEHACPECADVAVTFSHLLWPDATAEVVDSHFEALPVFTPQAFRQFLPAFMVRSLQKDNLPWGVNDVSEFTLYSLWPDEVSAWWRLRVDALTTDQVAVIVDFSDYVRGRSDEYRGTPPRQAAAYWEGRLAGRRTSGCS